MKQSSILGSCLISIMILIVACFASMQVSSLQTLSPYAVRMTQGNPIELYNADYNETTFFGLPNLGSVTENVTPRTIIEYGDYAVQQKMYAPIDMPIISLPRIIMEYADAASQLAITPPPQSLNTTGVTPRIIMEYADYATCISYLSYSGPDPGLWSGGSIGVTGYKLVFKQTINNSLSVPATIASFFWNFSVDKWNGAQWVPTGMTGSSTPVTGYVIPNSTILDLPYYVVLLPSSGLNAIVWGNWLKISYAFTWTYGGISHSIDYTAKLNVHPGDIAGASVTFPYLGADGKANLVDLTTIVGNWLKSGIPWTGTFDPTDALHRADINGDGKVNLLDLTYVVGNWLAAWTNKSPSG